MSFQRFEENNDYELATCTNKFKRIHIFTEKPGFKVWVLLRLLNENVNK